MHRHHTAIATFATAVALALVASAAHAQSQVVGLHPAVASAARASSAIDANRFLVQPPASVQWVHAHANGEHPAVLVAGRSAPSSVDANQFIVQPPAAVRWTLALLPAVEVAKVAEVAGVAALR